MQPLMFNAVLSYFVIVKNHDLQGFNAVGLSTSSASASASDSLKYNRIRPILRANERFFFDFLFERVSAWRVSQLSFPD